MNTQKASWRFVIVTFTMTHLFLLKKSKDFPFRTFKIVAFGALSLEDWSNILVVFACARVDISVACLVMDALSFKSQHDANYLWKKEQMYVPILKCGTEQEVNNMHEAMLKPQ